MTVHADIRRVVELPAPVSFEVILMALLNIDRAVSINVILPASVCKQITWILASIRIISS
jgi:hypothetical protein